MEEELKKLIENLEEVSKNQIEITKKLGSLAQRSFDFNRAIAYKMEFDLE